MCVYIYIYKYKYIYIYIFIDLMIYDKAHADVCVCGCVFVTLSLWPYGNQETRGYRGRIPSCLGSDAQPPTAAAGERCAVHRRN